ncbi:MAG: phosphotransferase [Methylococcaceae bacterium]|nr:phosphotransferase [Methylococcaceae bacterium]
MLSGSEQRIGFRIDGDHRMERMLQWLNIISPGTVHSIEPASSDASFRRYFRLTLGERTLIAMDAPPGVESIDRFIRVCRLFHQAGVCVPEILDFNEEQGFMLLGDLGSASYLARLDRETAPELYRDAMDVLRVFKHKLDIETCGLPDYGRDLLERELGLFEEWFLRAKLRFDLSDAELTMLGQVKDFLIGAVLEQPKIVVHRDFHSRNLMVLEEHNPGVLDFQDAVTGPLTYDLVSLLRDCYIAWPQAVIDRWVADYFSSLNLHGIDFEQFYRWFDLTGLQRHMKAVGIFSRLDIRDGKAGYLADIPRTLDYIHAVTARYPELSSFHQFLATSVAEPMAGPIFR